MDSTGEMLANALITLSEELKEGREQLYKEYLENKESNSREHRDMSERLLKSEWFNEQNIKLWQKAEEFQVSIFSKMDQIQPKPLSKLAIFSIICGPVLAIAAFVLPVFTSLNSTLETLKIQSTSLAERSVAQKVLVEKVERKVDDIINRSIENSGKK